MGEARRRGSKPPSALERVRRFGDRVWLLYPRPLRTFIRFETELVLWGVGIFGALILLALVLGLWHR